MALMLAKMSWHHVRNRRLPNALDLLHNLLNMIDLAIPFM